MPEGAGFARHARVLLDGARGEDPERIGAELDAFAAAFVDRPDLSKALLSPALTPSRKADVVRAVAAQGGLSRPVGAVLVRLAERNQLGIVPELAAAVRARLRERSNIVGADVTTAVPLSVEQTAAIARRLGAVTGKDVRVSAQVDPSILGGVVARVGSVVYDGSVARRLERMRQKLVENV